MIRRALTLLALLAALPAWAAPARYALEAADSEVAFSWDLGPDEVRGRMPVSQADLVIDFAEIAASRVDVSVSVAGAEAGFPFATQAMKGPKVLDAARFPEIVFRSTGVRRSGDGAEIEGNITVRGVTRPAVLQAQIYRQKGTAEGDLSQLSVLLTGTIRRSEFGATGWSDLAGDDVRLRILARIRRIE